MDSFWIQILIGAVIILHSCSCEKRLIEYAPPWQPVAIPAAAPQLISIGNFDATNKAQIAQIAHHNAQILRQIKGLHPPVTQYLNPFPVFPSVNSPKHVVMTASALPAHNVPTTQHLLSSSSNVAQTVMPQTVMKSYLSGKPTYISAGKPPEFKFFNGMASSKGPPVFLSQTSSSMPSLQIFSTTSRVPILRDVTLSSPSSMFKSTQLPNPPKFQAHMTFGPARPAASNQIPGQILSSYTHFGPAAPQILRSEPKQRIRANFLTAPFDPYHFANPYAGHLTAGGHFVAKNNFANSLYFPHNGLGSYQLTNTFIASPQKPNSQPFIQSPQQQQQHGPIQPVGPPQLPETQPSYLPQLPTVPPSVLSPFFQVQQKQQDVSTTPAPQSVQESPQNSHSNTFLLNDEYAINLVPPPPYKHTDSTRFRLRQPPPSTPSTLTSPSVPSTNSTPIGPHGNDEHIYDDEQKKAMDILNKYNIPAISPLQDANRYAYSSGQFTHPSSTPSSYSDEQIFQRWPVHDNSLSNSPSFTTEKPNIFRNLNRPMESEYHQHKIMHPGYTGARRPIPPATTPFLPTQDSLNNAITHSFFTIEDAITISPHTHYRRPVKPTNTNEIEASIKRPSNDIYTESASIDPFHGYGKDTDTDIVTIPPQLPPLQPITSTPRPRNKLRRKRPRPTTESTSTIDAERNQIKNSEFDDPTNEVLATEMPKNHKEYTATRDRGQLLQYTRETTTEIPREQSTSGYRNSNRVRNRTRISAPFESRFEPSTTSSPVRPKRPYNPENRRPNNRFEGALENRVNQRLRPVAEKSTRFPLDENEQTTIGQREYSRPSRRPLTTQQAIPISTTIQDETETHDFFFDTKLSNKIRNSSPSNIITTSLLTPTIESGDHLLEENGSILSTRLNVANEPLPTHEPEDSTNIDDEELATLEPQTQDSISLSSPSSSSSASSTSTSSTSTIGSTSSEKSEISNESIPSDGPVYIRDENKVEISNFRTRQRMRNKEKILEAVAAATSSQTKAVTKDRGHGYAHHNEVNDIENESSPSSSTEKESRLRVRLPVYKAGPKQSGEDVHINNVTKAIRLNGTNKFDPKNRPRFSIKEYRQRMSSTTPTPDQSTNNVVSTTASYTRLRFPTRQRVLPSELKNRTQDSNKIDEKPNIIYPEKSTIEPLSSSSSSSSSTESGVSSSETTRKRFVPKDRYSSRLKTTTETISEGQTIASPTSPSQQSTAKPPLRRVSTRRDSLINRNRSSSTTTDNPSDASNTVSRIPVIRNGTVPLRRPQPPTLRQRIQNKKNKDGISSTISADESLNDLAVEGSSEDKVRMSSNEVAPSTSTSTEEYKHETAIMKIAKDDHSYRPYKEKATTEKSKNDGSTSSSSENDLNDSPSEQSERVAELTIFGSNQFNSVNTGSASRRIPGYFTLATEDPILPIEAFFPQVKRSK